MPASRDNGILQFRDDWTAMTGLAPLSNIASHSFFEIINTLGVTVPTSNHWPMGDEGKQAMLQKGGVRSAPLPGYKPGPVFVTSGGVINIDTNEGS